MNPLSKYYANFRYPKGILGRYLVNAMNGKRHQALAHWALTGNEPGEEAHALDIGCGGGATVSRLLEMCPGGKVSGLDISPQALKVARKLNRKAIEKKRCAIVGGTVKQLPFIKGTFNLVTAFETIYYWPDIEECLKEVLRVLKPGGRFIVANETDGIAPEGEKWAKLIGYMHIYTIDELKGLMEQAGFVHIESRHDPTTHYISVMGEKA